MLREGWAQAETLGSIYSAGETFPIRSKRPALLHHHVPHSFATEWHRPLPSPIRFNLEPLMLANHLEEPVVRVTGREEAVGRR